MRLLSCSHQPPGSCLVTGDVPVGALLQLCGSDVIGVRNHLEISRIIETVLKDFLVRGDHLRMLLAELVFQVLQDVIERPVENEAGHPEGEHVLALVD